MTSEERTQPASMPGSLTPTNAGRPFYRADGSWACTRDHATEPCGECDGCRQVEAAKVKCVSCLRELPPGTRARRDPESGAVLCIDCYEALDGAL